MSDELKLTVCDKLLLSAATLHEAGRESFTAEDLVVAAWKNFPRTFGLRGHLDEAGLPVYPDSNRVYVEIMGSRPIRKRGLLSKVGEKLYRLNPVGVTAAAEIGSKMLDPPSGVSRESSGKMALPREIQTELERLLQTKAVQKADNGESKEITFHNACVFWNITPGSFAIDLEGSLSRIIKVIESSANAISAGGDRLRAAGSPVSSSTIKLLKHVHEHMLKEFEEEIATIKKRKDQRK